jgi:rod shape-determining protein MreD
LIKKILINFIIIAFLIALIYSKYIRFIEIFNVLPDIFLILTVFSGIFGGPLFAMIFGFASGLALDISTYPLIGFYALIYTVIGYSTSLIKLFYIDNILSSSILILIFIILKSIVFLITGLIFMESDFVANYFARMFLIETLYTLIIAIPIFLIYKKIYSGSRKSKSNV